MILYQPKNGYCYNSDTHFLFNFICKSLEKYKNISGDFLDIGSGSGILGLLLAKKYHKIYLNQVEIQDSFQFLSSKNSSINSIKSNLYKGSFLDINFDKKFDFCVSNPPFYHSSVIKSENESLKIARYNSSLPLYDFIKKSSQILNPNGKLFFCYDSKQLSNIVLFLSEFKLNIENIQFLHPKKDKEASLVMIFAKKDSKSLLKIDEPLIVFDENGDFSQTVQNIYNEINTHSIKVDFE